MLRVFSHNLRDGMLNDKIFELLGFPHTELSSNSAIRYLVLTDPYTR